MNNITARASRKAARATPSAGVFTTEEELVGLAEYAYPTYDRDLENGGGKAARVKKPRAPAGTGIPREGTKVGQVIAMLKAPGGATLEQIKLWTGWKTHSIRVLMSAGGAIWKRFGLMVISERNVDGARTYRIG